MSNPRRANGTKRDRLVARVKREESHCHLCEQWVDVRLPHGLPGSPEVDELLPVIYGGNPLDRTNCRLAHRWCNRKRWYSPVEIGKAEIMADPPRFDASGQLVRAVLAPIVSRSW